MVKISQSNTSVMQILEDIMEPATKTNQSCSVQQNMRSIKKKKDWSSYELKIQILSCFDIKSIRYAIDHRYLKSGNLQQ